MKSIEQTEYKSKGNYYKICGKRFWELISGEPDLYIKLIEPLGHEAEKRNIEFKKSYGSLINRLTKEFLEDFCNENGSINWEKLLIFNSSSDPQG
ncbi:MAG: PmeII family type II restriction endonuclease [Bacteroidetes bacterium]|nr:PmeII family type II restriction endonuclease [Bacteroidota bacterium]